MPKRPVNAEDLFRIAFVSNPQMDPDGRRVALSVKTADLEGNRYRSHLWIAEVATRARRQFTFGDVVDALPKWSPDGGRIAFIRRREHDSQLFLIHADGGEAYTATKLPEGTITFFDWSPDGREIVLAFRPAHPDWTQSAREERERAHRSNPPRVITRLHYRVDGAGFLDCRQHLWVCDTASGATRQLTDGEFDEEQPAWSPDGKWIAFMSNRDEDADFRPHEADIWLASPDGASLRRVNAPKGHKTSFAWSPDARRIAYVGYEHDEDPLGGRNDRLYVVEVYGQGVERLTEGLDRTVGNATLSDAREAPTGGGIPVWSADGTRLHFLVSTEGACRPYVTPARGSRPAPLGPGPSDVAAMTADRQAGIFALLASDPTRPAEVFVLDVRQGKRGEVRQLTDFNRGWLEEVSLSEPEEVWVAGKDGARVQSWVLRPPAFDPAKRHPLLLYVHGGPHLQYGATFFHELQWHAARGYVVVYCNPRGSLGYAESYARCIRGKWGDLDYQDVMAVAERAASLPYVDPERMGIAGGSYGGYMTNWALGHTDRFKCGVTDRSVVSLHSMAGTGDFVFRPNGYWPGNAWERPEALWEQSPLRYAGNMRAPLLIIHSEGDLRCPVEQGEQLYAALKWLRREVVFVRYPMETSHGLSRGGPPDLRLDRLRRIGEWLDRWLEAGAA